MARINQINSLLLKELAALVEQEIVLDQGLITISYVECSPDLRYAKVGVSVLPDKLTGTAKKNLAKHSAYFSGRLRKKIKIRCIPKFHWVADTREKNAATIEKTLGEIYGQEKK